MNPTDFESMDLADEVLDRIEKSYGRSIQRIAKFNPGTVRSSFNITVVFSDFRLFEGQILIREESGEVVIFVEGLIL
jgi:hypothetical protein